MLATSLDSLNDQIWRSCTEITLGIRRIALRTFSKGTWEGVPCKRMKLALRTSGRAEEKMMTVMMKEITGSA